MENETAKKPATAYACAITFFPAKRDRDHLAVFVVTAGEGIRERSGRRKTRILFGRTDCIAGHRTAEACAEWLHRQFEKMGIPGSAENDHGATVHVALSRPSDTALDIRHVPDLEDQAAFGNY